MEVTGCRGHEGSGQCTYKKRRNHPSFLTPLVRTQQGHCLGARKSPYQELDLPALDLRLPSSRTVKTKFLLLSPPASVFVLGQLELTRARIMSFSVGLRSFRCRQAGACLDWPGAEIGECLMLGNILCKQCWCSEDGC